MRTGELHTAPRAVTRDELEAMVWAISRTRDTRSVDRLMKVIDLYVAWRIETRVPDWMPTKEEAEQGMSTAERDVTWRETHNRVRRERRAEERVAREATAGPTLRERMEAITPVAKPAQGTSAKSRLEEVECSRCHKMKKRGPGGDFNQDLRKKSGYHSQCRDCRREQRQSRKELTQEPITRVCSKCGEEKNAANDFYQRASGLRRECKECEKKKRNARRAAQVAAQALGI
jgi:hypothetical protein